MTKTELIQELAERNEITLKAAGQYLASFIDIVGDELKAGNEVSIMGFGKFTAKLVKGREGKNPRDPKGPNLIIPDTNRVYFSSGQALKDKVNEAPKKSKKSGKAMKAAAPAKKAAKKKKK